MFQIELCASVCRSEYGETTGGTGITQGSKLTMCTEMGLCQYPLGHERKCNEALLNCLADLIIIIKGLSLTIWGLVVYTTTALPPTV